MERIEITKKNVKKVGSILKEKRLLKEFPQKIVGKKMQKDQSRISGIENGPRTPSLGTIVEYLSAIGCKIYIE